MTMPISRRTFLQTGAMALAGSAMAAPAPADFSFAVLNDLHYRDARCGDWFQRVTASLLGQRPRPAFIVLAGDLSDLGTGEQLGAVHEIFRALPMPVHRIIGNHDYTLEGSREPYERTIGASLNFRFTHAGCEFLALDTTQKRSVYRTHIPAETFTWLDRQLPTVSRDRPLIVLTHFPLGRNWLRPLNAHTLVERLRPYPLQAVFSGHWHGLTDRLEHSIHLSTSRCCSWWRTNHDGSPEKGYALCEMRDGQVSHRFVPV
jgi:predicted MPP superfamily phosphohydrolase